jgi:hypothetical protein
MALRLQANLPRLQSITSWLESSRLAPGQLNLATYMATHRTDEERAPVGCVLGHFARSGTSHVISLVPIRYLEQIKSPMLAEVLLEDHPSSEWIHWTLHYQTATSEAFGETAAMLYLQMRQWDINRLFYPAGSSYEIRPPVESLVFRLRSMLETIS